MRFDTVIFLESVSFNRAGRSSAIPSIAGEEPSVYGTLILDRSRTLEGRRLTYFRLARVKPLLLQTIYASRGYAFSRQLQCTIGMPVGPLHQGRIFSWQEVGLLGEPEASFGIMTSSRSFSAHRRASGRVSQRGGHRA